MDAGTRAVDILHDFAPIFRVYKDGRVEKFNQTPIVPPSDDPITGVRSKDVVISPENSVSARLYLPKITDPTRKLPLLIYIHGGGFAIESAFSSQYHSYVNSLVSEANVVAVSVEYRLAPEYHVAACYDDTWTAMQWVASHANNSDGSEPWLKNHADFGQIFLSGDSAGGNLAHSLVVRATEDGGGLGPGVKIAGLILVHSFFGRDGDTEKGQWWEFISRGSMGLDDIRLNPAAHPVVLGKLACGKVLVITAENDFLRDRGLTYYEALKKSNWGGSLELFETEGETHVFHLLNPSCDKAQILLKRVVSFINHQD